MVIAQYSLYRTASYFTAELVIVRYYILFRVHYSPNVHYSLDLFFRLLTIRLHHILCQSVSAIIILLTSCGLTWLRTHLHVSRTCRDCLTIHAIHYYIIVKCNIEFTA